MLDISTLIWGIFFIPLRDSERGKKSLSLISMSPSSFDQAYKGIFFCEYNFLSGLLYFNFLDVKKGTEDKSGIEMRGYEHDSYRTFSFKEKKTFVSKQSHRISDFIN